MITFPIDSSSSVVIIGPGNIRRLKEGSPLKVRTLDGSFVLICFTPDIVAFQKNLGFVPENLPFEKFKVVSGLDISPKSLDNALKATQNLPEVESIGG